MIETASARPWWETRLLVALVIVAVAVPLLYPPLPPLVDLLGHMGRYRVELDLAHSPWLQRYYTYQWAAIGNLGVDLLVYPLGKLIGLEPAVRLIVLAIPPMTAAGFLWVAREVHGRIPPTALFAIPFVYGHPFLFGFVNFALAMALAFLAFGLWLRLAHQGRTRLRAALFVPISLTIFFCHVYGWGTLGLLCFSAEAVRQHDRGTSWWRAGLRAALQASVMALPILVMLLWRSGVSAHSTGDWFDWKAKAAWLDTALRDRWKWFDIGALALTGLVIVEALRNPRLTFSRNLAFSGLVLVAAFVCVPRILFGSAYADMRLVPYMIAVLILAIRFRGETNFRLARALAIAGVLFLSARLAGNTVSLAIAAQDQRAKLAALDHVPMGARVASFVGTRCGDDWALMRNSHLGGMVIVRRQGFSNDQWVIQGANLLGLKVDAGPYGADPSQIVRASGCGRGTGWSVGQALRFLPRDKFDYVWLVDAPPFPTELVAGMKPVWRGPGSVLYQVRP